MLKFYFPLVFIFLLNIAEAQDSLHRLANRDTLPVKNFKRAATELLIAQVLPWSWNNFVRKADFAHINFKSIGKNLKFRSWEWDDNSFNTNQFSHPYHGSLYFSSFRTNGYSFWQSAPAALVGSFMWETAGETHPPAIMIYKHQSWRHSHR
jgi:hypothetical protein